MFSCQESRDVYLTFGRVKRHVRTFKLKPTDPSLLYQPAGTLWLRLPRSAGPAIYELQGIAHTRPIERGLDRGIDIIFEDPEGHIVVSYETLEDTTAEGSIVVDFRYGKPEQPGWKEHLSAHKLKVVFHFPVGIPPSWTNWTQRFGFIRFLQKKGVPTTRRSQPRVLLILKEYYALPWGYDIDYGFETKEGKLDSLLITPRRLIYNENLTEWVRKSWGSWYFVVRPRSTVEAPIIAVIIGLLLNHFTPIPIWLIILILILFLPIFSRGLIWKILHLMK